MQWTANQIVAANLKRVRRIRKWSQAEAAEACAPYLRELWSTAVWSSAERSVAGKRIRSFDADTLLAFARGFEVPIDFFFRPPFEMFPNNVDDARIAPDNARVVGVIQQALTDDPHRIYSRQMSEWNEIQIETANARMEMEADWDEDRQLRTSMPPMETRPSLSSLMELIQTMQQRITELEDGSESVAE